MEQHIGIIVMNYDEKIFLCEDGYFIKSFIGENENIENVIKKEIKHYLDRDIFRIVKIFKKKLLDIDKERTMYLVEVGIYTKEFEFVDAEKIVYEIVNINYKTYLQNNLIEYDKNNGLASNMINLSIIFIVLDIIPRFIIKSETIMFLPLFGLIGILYLIGAIIVKPKLINILINVKINTSIAIIAMNTIATLYCIRLFMLAR